MAEIIQTQLIRIKLTQFETNILEFICKRSNSLWNQGIYYINADCNAAANMLRKVSTKLGLVLSGVSRSASEQRQLEKDCGTCRVRHPLCNLNLMNPTASSRGRVQKA